MFKPFSLYDPNEQEDTQYLQGLNALSSLTGVDPNKLHTQGQAVMEQNPEMVAQVTQQVTQPNQGQATTPPPSDPIGDAVRAALAHQGSYSRGVAIDPEISDLRNQAEKQALQQTINGGSYNGWDALRDIGPGALTALAALAFDRQHAGQAMGQISGAIAQQISDNAKIKQNKLQLANQQASSIASARASDAAVGLRDPERQALNDKAQLAISYQTALTNKENAANTGALRNVQAVRTQLEVEDKDPTSGLNSLRRDNYNQDLARLGLKDESGNPIQIPAGVRPEEYIKNSPLLDETTKTQLLQKSEAIRDDYAAKQVGREIWASGQKAYQSEVGTERGLQATSDSRVTREQGEGKITARQKQDYDRQQDNEKLSRDAADTQVALDSAEELLTKGKRDKGGDLVGLSIAGQAKFKLLRGVGVTDEEDAAIYKLQSVIENVMRGVKGAASDADVERVSSQILGKEGTTAQQREARLREWLRQMKKSSEQKYAPSTASPGSAGSDKSKLGDYGL